MIWNEINALISENGNFLITSHVNPDGDNIASQLSLYWYLSTLGKKVTVFDVDNIPVKFRFLENSDVIVHEKPTEKFDVLVILDSSNSDRVGWVVDKSEFKKVLIIDHHRDNSREGDVNIVNPKASATSEIIYRFFSENNVEITRSVAETLYTGIMTDTGGLQFSNTTSFVLRACADLVDKGADCSAIYKKVYASFSRQGLKLRSKIWSTLEYLFDGKVALMYMHNKEPERLCADYGEIEGMSDQTLLAEGVEVGIFVKYDENSTHFSLRSAGRIDVGSIAQNIPGGGGHVCAAGCTIESELESAKEDMIKILSGIFDGQS